MANKSRKKKQRLKDIRNLRRRVKKNLRRKAKENIKSKGKKEDIMGKNYKKGLRILRELINNRKLDGFTFIYEPGLYGDGASVLSASNGHKNQYIMMIDHICSTISSFVDIVASFGPDRQEVLAMVIDSIKERVPEMECLIAED